MQTIIKTVQQALIENIDEKTRDNAQSFFKEKILYHGVKVPLVNKISKELFTSIKELPKNEIFSLCETLWKSGYSEESYIACNWSYYIHTQYQPEDFTVFEKWVNSYVNNWASCDTLCNHTIGTFIEMYPDYIFRLKEWARSDNRWTKRAAAVTLIIPARKGMFLQDIFEIADILLYDPDDLVQKGYGWMLKAASEAHQEEVFDYVMSKKATMPRTSLRYAIEKMPKELKVQAMAK
ncbi:DNA alkylation repair protein [Parabacteroides sp. GYB001]|uniref:DNA alkylation repair protein n=1 Tax=Parabacteroides leei TaxID=2939491 RepID=UPI00201713AD|nr:DNA alkylation repair protein [Parabacteroides leei]MCL3850246.1 DNA alkylation repair protein [Parabacteroides leei]